MSDSKRLSIFLFILGLFIGSLTTLSWNYFRPFNTKYGNITEIKSPQKPRSLLDLLIGENPFADLMENMHTQMENDENGGFQFHFNLGDLQNIEPSVDDKFYYFTLNLNDLKAKTLNVNVEDNQIIVQAQLERSESDENSSHSVTQSFSKAFPAPPNSNLDKIEIENKDNKIIIKVPKTN